MEETPGDQHKESDPNNFAERFSRFKEEIEHIAKTAQDLNTMNPIKHFEGSPNFDLIADEDKKAMVDIWDKIKAGTIGREELSDFTVRASSKINKNVEDAGMTREKSFRATLSGVISLFNNRASPAIIRREMREKR